MTVGSLVDQGQQDDSDAEGSTAGTVKRRRNDFANAGDADGHSSPGPPGNDSDDLHKSVPTCWEFIGIVQQNGVQRTTYLIQKQNNKKQSSAVFRDFLEQEATSSKTKDIFRISVQMHVE